MRGLPASLAVLHSLLLIACASMEIRTEHDASVRFSELRSYAWSARDPEEPTSPELDMTGIEVAVREAVDAGLQRKGFRPAEAGEADFLVHARVAVEERVSRAELGDWTGPGHGSGRRSSPMARDVEFAWEAGSLVLDVLDPSGSKLLWRGTAEAEVDPAATPEESEARAREAVERLLERFPPRQG